MKKATELQTRLLPLVAETHTSLADTLARGFDDEGIHQLRLAIKRLRAWWRLLRPLLGTAVWRGRDRALRAAAQPFGPARDAVVLRETLAELAQGSAQAPVLRRARRRVLVPQPPSAAIREVLAVLAADCAAWQQLPSAWQAAKLGEGLRQSYQRVRRLWQATQEDDRPEQYHRWRKAVKQLSFQLPLFGLVDQAKAWRRLGTHLGERHDGHHLALQLVTLGLPASALPELLQAISQRDCQAAKACAALGAKLCGQSSRAWVSSRAAQSSS